MTTRARAIGPALLAGVLLAALPPAAAIAQPGHAERVEHHDATSPPSRGPVNALVTIELFFVPGVSTRAQNVRKLEALQAKHPSRIRLIYRVVSSGGSIMLPSALLEAHAQGKFFETLDAINSRTSTLNKASILELAGRLGLDTHRVAAAMAHGPDALAENKARLDRFHRQAPDVLFNGVPLERPFNSADDNSLDAAYRTTLDRAEDLLDRGADPDTLAEAFVQQALAAVETEVQPSGATDDDVDAEPADPPLATPPLALAGLPSLGRPDAALPIVLLCSPVSMVCRSSIDHAREVQRLYPDLVRVVWAPWYDVARADAVDLGLLSDAALCAEVVGTASNSDGEEASSSGWRWVTAVLDATLARHGRKVPAVDTIDAVAHALHVDERAFADCRASSAGAAVERIAAARHSGVRGAPTLAVGGRLYLRGLPDSASLQRLVEAELAPGILGELAPTWARPKLPETSSR